MSIKVIDQEAVFYGVTPDNAVGTMRRIEFAGRLCYNSTMASTNEESEIFVNNLITKDHTSILEHSNIVVEASINPFPESSFIRFDKNNKLAAGNIRAWHECFFGRGSGVCLSEFYQRLNNEFYTVTGDQIPQNLRRVSVLFVTDRAVTHEIVRHRRGTAFSQQSQRYVAYNSHIDIIKPWFFDNDSKELDVWLNGQRGIAELYMNLLSSGWSPQKARTVLSNSTATKIFVTADIPAWQWMFKLRCSKAAYPQIRALMTTTRALFTRHGLEVE